MRKRFYCKALQGKSGYNICVNSDMTVSCNCMDYFGNGQIGNLRESTLGEIFSSEAARRLRQGLYEGEMPIPECRGCPELAVLGEDEDEGVLENFTVPKNGMMIENTVVCNLKCLHCNRVDLMKTRGQKAMSLDDMRIVSKTFRDNGIGTMHFFNLGEPFLSRRVHEELRIIREDNPQIHIQTSTNGMLLDSDMKRDAALLMNHIFFSIDGSDQESSARYQVGMDFEKSYENLKRLVAYRKERGVTSLILEWKYVVFPWNSSKEQIDRAIAMASECGVDILSFFRGGGDDVYSPKQFQELSTLQGVGFVSWKGKEIDFHRFDYVRAEALLTMAVDAATNEDRLSIASELFECIKSAETLSSEELVRCCYELVLKRNPDAEGGRVYRSLLEEGKASVEGIIVAFLESDEFRATRENCSV